MSLIRGTVNSRSQAWSTSLLRYVDLTVNDTGQLVVTTGGGGGSVDQGAGGASAWLVTGPLTDAQLRATPVPVGTIVGQAGVTAGAGNVDAGTQRVVLATDVALPAGTNALGHITADFDAMAPASGTISITTVGDNVALSGLSKLSSIYATLSINGSGAGELDFQASLDGGTTWFFHPVEIYKVTSALAPTFSYSTTVPAITNGDKYVIRGSLFGGVTDFRVITGGGSTQTVSTRLGASATPASTALSRIANSTGSGAVNIQDGGNSITVDGSITASGNKTNNNAAPGATNVGALPAVAAAAAPAYTEGNLVALSTDLAGNARVAVSGAVSVIPTAVTEAADVLAADTDAGYTAGQTTKNVIQTPDGRLRVVAAGKVSDTRESYNDGDVRSLSITTDGRLRVSSSEAALFVEMFREADNPFFDTPMLTALVDTPANPWGF